MLSNAVISPDAQYRYALDREWAGLFSGGVCCWVMLNPSTADAQQDDPTVRRCIYFAQRWGYQAITVLNLFAYRATDPKELRGVEDPVGPDNELWFERVLGRSDAVVCAWGNHGNLHGQSEIGLEWIRRAGHEPLALRVTGQGQPQHPLYLPSGLAPEPMEALCSASL